MTKARFWLEAKRTIPLGTVNERRAKPAGFSAAEQALTQASRASVVRASWPPAAIDLALDYGNNKQKAAARGNIRKAAAAAKRKRTVAHLPKTVRTALGKKGAKAARKKKQRR
jgi:hypothetical protein